MGRRALRRLRRARPLVQAVAFIGFLVLWFRAAAAGAGLTDLFFLADPLAGIAVMLASRQVVLGVLIGSALALLLAFLAGRVWCGWLCPLGSLLDALPRRRSRRGETDPTPRLRGAKYWLLIGILVAAALGNLTLLVLDPITLMHRTFTVAVWPAFNALVNAGEAGVCRWAIFRPLVDLIEGSLRGPFLPIEQPVYGAALLFALVLALILGLEALRRRFWCRYLCPLGGLLGLVSKVALLRRTVDGECRSCSRCSRSCPTGAIDEENFSSNPAECIVCLDCVPACAGNSQEWSMPGKPAAWERYDPSRRQVLTTAGAAVALVGGLGAEPAATRPQRRLIRPPGADPDLFPSECIRCGICLRACPTHGLQPGATAAGLAGLWTPVLMPRLGHCDFACNACGQACPTGAIPMLDLATKRQTIIGVAAIDRSRCLPWTDGTVCLVCEEMCPLPAKAIELEHSLEKLPDGTEVEVPLPHVRRDLCIGCGICENRCPVGGDAAIRVETLV
jgi:MauM/NapG family ferredoxin protein